MEQVANRVAFWKIDADCLACDLVAFVRLPKPKKVNCETILMYKASEVMINFLTSVSPESSTAAVCKTMASQSRKTAQVHNRSQGPLGPYVS
jgi:hypothetical protein